MSYDSVVRVVQGTERNCEHEEELESPNPGGEVKSARGGEENSLQVSDQRMLQGNWECQSRQAFLSQLN